MKKYSEASVLIAINALKNIITIFLGPFLTAYFIKVSTETLIDLSLYNIMSYLVLATVGFIIGYIIRNKFQLGMFRVGIISNFIYILVIIILKEQILNYLPLISFLYGFSAIAYHYPYNLFITTKIKNYERTEYEFTRKTVSTLVSIITPFVLGSIITTTNFELTAIIILFISLLQIILSFVIKPIEDKNYQFTPIKSLKKFINNKEIVNMLRVDYFKGMSVSEGALEVILTILIFNAFKTDLNLGLLSSLSSILIIIVQYLYTKKFKHKNDKTIIAICSIIPILSLFLLNTYTNDITLILYYFCYTTSVNLLALLMTIRLFNISNSKAIKDGNLMEFWSIREVVLNLGRITGYSLLLIVGLLNQFDYLHYLMIILTLSIAAMGYFLSKVGKYEDIE